MSTHSSEGPRLSDAQLAEVLALTKDADSVELKLTVPDPERRATINALNLVVEVDAMPGGYVCSASMKGTLGTTDVKKAAAGDRPIRKLYSREQRAFFEANAPAGVSLDDLAILGPITVLKVKFSPEDYQRRLVAELWLYPDGSRILELSTKCAPTEGFQVAAEIRAFLTSKGISLSGEQQTKTKAALEYFAASLGAAAEA